MKYEISDIGKKVLAHQEKIAKLYNYKKLPNDLAEEYMQKYYNNLPNIFKVSEKLPIENGSGYYVKSADIPIFSREEMLIANKYDRIVIGHYGAFIEFDQNDAILDNFIVPERQKYRYTDKYKDYVAYYWYTTKDTTNCKLYLQRRYVSYANYLPNKWYISPYEVLGGNL